MNRRSSGAALILVLVGIVSAAVIVLTGASRHHPASSSGHRLTVSEYRGLVGGYQAWQSSFLALLDRVQTAADMRIDVALVLAVTSSSRNPGGACGIDLTAYLNLLRGYARAVGRGRPWGPPTNVTVSDAEQRTARACRPASAS